LNDNFYTWIVEKIFVLSKNAEVKAMNTHLFSSLSNNYCFEIFHSLACMAHGAQAD